MSNAFYEYLLDMFAEAINTIKSEMDATYNDGFDDGCVFASRLNSEADDETSK